MSETKELVPISRDLLYEGFVVPDHVYGADAKLPLIRGETVLDAEMLEMIRTYGGDSKTVFVSEQVGKQLISDSVPCEVVGRHVRESETGYAETKDATLKLLEEISDTGVMPQATLQAVSDDLSHKLAVNSPAIILDLVNALAPVDEYLQRHCINVGLLCGLLGRWMKLPKAEVDMLTLTGLLHDCGKALMPRKLITAPRPLTGAEFEVIKLHTVRGYELMRDFPERVRLAARAHHEKYGGGGYPDSLTGCAIPVMARITTVCDVYDAMVSRRAYKKPQSPFHIMARLLELRGSELDPELVDVFIQNMPMELVGKPVLMSNGAVGMIHSVDIADIEYPLVELNGQIVKSNERLYCRALYFDDMKWMSA